MDSPKFFTVLDYSSRRPCKRLSWKSIIRVFVLPLASILLWLLSGTPADISTAKEPFDGHFIYRSAQAQILQETIWHQGKLVSAWEIVERSSWINGYLIVDPPRWEQVVKDGYGRLSELNAQGKHEGFENYSRGDPTDGAH